MKRIELMKTCRNLRRVSGGFPAGFRADQERVSWETRRKNMGGIKVPTRGLFYIIFSLIYIPPIFFNKKYTRKHRSGAEQNPPEKLPAGFGGFPAYRHQIKEITRRSFRRLSEMAVAA